MNLANNLRKIRKENNLSQEQLAEKLGVSRQSVSKWESEQAYPEMEKMIQICDLFDITMDELLNQNVSAVNEAKEEKTNLAKHIESFLNYVNKTIDLFSSMTHLQRFKCLIEQIIYVLILTAVFGIVGALCRNILSSFIGYGEIMSFLKNVYIAICVLAGATLMFQIFKIRYLNYCEIVENPESGKSENLEIETTDEESKRIGKRIFQREKIIIRDPNHSEYKFISGLVKILFCIFKAIIGVVGVCVCLCLIAEFATLAISFKISRSGFLFTGALITILGIISITVILLLCVYSIIFSHKFRKSILAIIFACSLAVTGAGVGVGILGTMDLKKVTSDTTQYVATDTLVVDSAENFFVFELPHEYSNYIQTDSKDIKIVATYPKYNDSFIIEKTECGYGYTTVSQLYSNDMNAVTAIKNIVNLLNDGYAPTDFYEIKVYASKENIAKMIKNAEDYRVKISN